MVEGYRVRQHQYKAFLLRCMLSAVERGRSPLWRCGLGYVESSSYTLFFMFSDFTWFSRAESAAGLSAKLHSPVEECCLPQA